MSKRVTSIRILMAVLSMVYFNPASIGQVCNTCPCSVPNALRETSQLFDVLTDRTNVTDICTVDVNGRARVSMTVGGTSSVGIILRGRSTSAQLDWVFVTLNTDQQVTCQVTGPLDSQGLPLRCGSIDQIDFFPPNRLLKNP